MSIGPNSTKNQVDLTPPEPKPIFSILLMILMAAPMYVADNNPSWLQAHAFTASKFAEFQSSANYGGLLGYLCTATFSQLSALTWIFNAIFVWVLGNIVERKLKGWRYPLFVIVLVVASWSLVYVQSGIIDTLYIGPSMLLFGILGGYFAFFPKKAFVPQQWIKPSTQIFQPKVETKTEDRYWVSPWLYVIAFGIWQAVLQGGLMLGKDGVIKLTQMEQLGSAYTMLFGQYLPSDVRVAAFAPVAALASIAVGAIVALILPHLAMSLKTKRPGGKIQVEVLQHYKQLRKLDMTHDQACEGAARFASVPIDIAKDWISKGAAGLKDQGLH